MGAHVTEVGLTLRPGRPRSGSRVITVVVILISLMMVFPFVWMILISMKTPFELAKEPLRFWPSSLNFTNYLQMFGVRYKYHLLYFNSIKVTAINVVGGVLTSALAGYAFGRLKFWGRDFWFILYLATLMIPPQIRIIPLFLLFNGMGIIDTHWALILPGLFSVIATFLFRQYFQQLPMELSESAYMDGAGDYRILFQIIMPLAKPAIMAVVILNFAWHWNDYINPLVFLVDSDLYTLPLGLDAFADQSGIEMVLVAAATTLAVIPSIVVFVLAQKHFVRGLVAGTIK